MNITRTGLSLTSTAGGPTYAPNLVSSGQSTNDASWNLPTAIGIDRLMLALDQADITATAASSLTLFGTSTARRSASCRATSTATAWSAPRT